MAHPPCPTGDAARVVLVDVAHGRRIGQLVESALLGPHHREARDQSRQVARTAVGTGGVLGGGVGLKEQADPSPAALAAIVVNRHGEESATSDRTTSGAA